MIWCALTGTYADTGTFIIRYLMAVAKITHEDVIGMGGYDHCDSPSFGAWGKFGSLKPHFLGGSLDIATLAHMTIIDTKGGINKYPHHKQVLFTFPEATRTTISNNETRTMIV